VSDYSSPIIVQDQVLGMPRVIFYGWLAIAGLIAALSLWPEGLLSHHYHLDKFAHFCAYATLTGIPALYSTSRSTILVVGMTLIFVSAGLELAQYLLPDRWPSLLDLGANVVGVLAGTVSAWFLRKFLQIWPWSQQLAAKLLLPTPTLQSQRPI